MSESPSNLSHQNISRSTSSESSYGGESPSNLSHQNISRNTSSESSHTESYSYKPKNLEKHNSDNNINITKKFLIEFENFLVNKLNDSEEIIKNKDNVIETFRNLVIKNEELILSFPNNSTLLKIAEDSSGLNPINVKILHIIHEKILLDKKNNSKLKYW